MQNKIQKYIQLISNSVRDAEVGKSNLHPSILDIDGMSSKRMRHFINNVFQFQPSLKYLEIGSWKGSTFCSALSNNKINATSIENFSEFQTTSINGKQPYSSRDSFFFNVGKTLETSTVKSDVGIIEEDSWKVDVSNIKDVDVYFYDGHHSYESQYNAYKYYDSCFSDIFITFVDDYNINPRHNLDVQKATQKAFDDLGYTIHKEWHLVTPTDGDIQMSLDYWWNGVYVAVVEKNKK